MSETHPFPAKASRGEDRRIRDEVELVHEGGQSRAILLYGTDSVSKALLVRRLARDTSDDPATIWLPTIDIEGSENWLMSNLERLIANQLDPDNQYFGQYLTYLSGLPDYTRQRAGPETVISHLGRIKNVFNECYRNFIQGSGKTVVIVFDAVEAIRDMYLMLTLTQWIKSLPGTLFILSGRPLPGLGDVQDSIKDELEDPYQGIPVTIIHLLETFAQQAAIDYLNQSTAGTALSKDEKIKLAYLARGHPIWLAFTVDYLINTGMPDEAYAPLAHIKREMPYLADMTQVGQNLHEEFKRRLMTPYLKIDFWHEAIKRLAVVRESVNQQIWQQLMADRPLPDGVADFARAWDQLLNSPLIVARANRRYMTLHNAVAEELAQRIIPLHDQDERWRHEVWRHAATIYHRFTDSFEMDLAEQQAELEDRQQPWDALLLPEGMRRPSTDWDERRVIQESARLETQKHELCQLRAVRLYYEILCDSEAGCRMFLGLMNQAQSQHDILFQDLLALKMQRFLPGGVHSDAFGDVIGKAIDAFRHWLTSAGHDLYLEVGLSMANYLIRNEQPGRAMDLLAHLPEDSANHLQRYRLSNLQGNACMRIPGQARRSLEHFQRAVEEARWVPECDRPNMVAAAHKELGFCYRNEGLWEEADKSYQAARDAMLTSRSTTDDDREEMASIQTNWAYVKGLRGAYRDGANLVESAIAIRRRLQMHLAEGISWSVCGEVHRYERRFEKAWQAYAEAEQIFQGERNWPWLGLLYQEQAICLFQANQENINLIPGRDQLELARRLITQALDLCRDLAIRGLPSALNRAGRIFGRDDHQVGLGYLAEGVDLAHKLSDGWFWFANLIEYVELSYRAWVRTGDQAYRDQITGRVEEINQAMAEYEFAYLRGRWILLQGHLRVRDWQTNRNSELGAALEHYKEGFAQIAQWCTGSSGAAAMADEFRTFADLVRFLPPETWAEWQNELRSEWHSLKIGSASLLARLDELHSQDI